MAIEFAPQASDEDLLVRAGRGDRCAFESVVASNHAALTSFVQRYLATSDRNVVDDVTQQTWLGAWQACPKFVPRARVRTWLFRIAINTCLNYRRSQRLRRMAPLSGADERSADSTVLEENPNIERLRIRIQQLPERQRCALLLKHYHDFSYRQIAETLEVSVPAVESLLFRARRTLAKDLQDE